MMKRSIKKEKSKQKTITLQQQKEIKSKKEFFLKRFCKWLFKPSLIRAICLFLFVSLFSPRAFATTYIGRYCATNGLDSNLLYQTYYYGVDNGVEYFRAYSFCKGWQLFTTSIILAIIVSIYTRDLIKEDILKIKDNPKAFFKIVGITALPFALGMWMISYLLGNLGISNNETTLRYIFLNGVAVPVIFASLIFTPITEELIFRKCIWTFVKKFDWMHISFSYGVSTLFFAVPHLLTTQYTNLGMWLVMIIPYFIAGLSLAFIYDKSKENIFASICAHFTNNLLVVIFLLII